MARPRLQIDAELVEKLAMIQCTPKEIGSIVGCSEDTIQRRFAGIIQKGRDKGKMSLRRTMYEKAQAGNAVLLIWLSKQYLGMTDKMEAKNEHTGKDGAPVETLVLTTSWREIPKDEGKS